MGERIETGLTVGSSRRLDRSRKTRQRRVATYPEPPSPFSPLGILASWRFSSLPPLFSPVSSKNHLSSVSERLSKALERRAGGLERCANVSERLAKVLD